MQKPLSVGVIGCGGIAQMMHLPTLAERPDLFRIAALADLSPATLDVVGRRYGVTACTTDPKELIARPDVEAVLLACSGSHAAAAIATLATGKPLFSEKPLAHGFGELAAIEEAARGSKSLVQVGYHKRFDPAYVRACEAVRALGELRFVQVTVLHPDDNAYRTHHALLPPRTWTESTEGELNAELQKMLAGDPFSALLDDIAGKEASPGQRTASFILYDSLLHDLNAVRGVLGEPEEVLSAHWWNEGMAQTSTTRFARGVHANLSWVSLPGLKHYEESLLFVAPKGRVKLTFPSPYLRHHPTALTIERMEGGALVEEHHTVSYEEAFRAELHAFRAAVLENRPPELGLAEVRRDTTWIQAIAQSYRGRAVQVATRDR